MPSPSPATFTLHAREKVMLNAFIRGTTLANPKDADSLWTTEALTGLQSILENTIDQEAIPPHLVQDLLCIFADLIMRKDTLSTDTEFTRIMVKFMHYLVTLIDWTRKKKLKGKFGRGAVPTVALSVDLFPNNQTPPEITPSTEASLLHATEAPSSD